MDTQKVPAITRIETLVKDIPGWTPIDQLYTLYTIAMLTSDLEGDLVEVGSWCGRSAIVLGLAAQQCPGTRVFCIDLFPAKNDWKQNADGTYSFDMVLNGKRYGGYQEQTVWKETFESQTGRIYDRYESVFDCFSETVATAGQEDVIVPHRGDLASFIETATPDFKCRLAFLDGDHGYEAVRNDIATIGTRLVPGGWLCFDDAFTTYDGVNRAIAEMVLDSPDYDRCQQMTRKLFIARKRG